MKPHCLVAWLAMLAFSVGLATGSRALAQAAAAPAAASTAKNPAAKEDAITLSVFEVKPDDSDTYQANNTSFATGTNTELNKTPLDAKIFNRQMLDDMAVVDMTDMLWKLGGLGPAVINANEDVRGMVEGDRQDPKSMSMRGLQINNPRRDGFLRSDTTLLDSFDIERVEAIGGSNSLLFGSGDAGGVITSASKRAYLRRRPTMTWSATGDSEGTRRYTLDTQFGLKYFAFRANAVRDDTKYFRPGLKRHADGYQLAATIQPWKRLQIRGEFRHYNRDTIFAQAMTITAPTNLLLPARDLFGYPIPNTTTTNNQMNGKSARYLIAFPEAQALLGNVFDYRKVDSGVGPFHRDDYFNQIKSVVAEATLADGLAVQVRYGHDARVNDAFRASSTTAIAPGVASNAYLDPATGRVGTAWAFNTTQTTTPFFTGARGYRASVAYQKDLGKWFGRHQANVFRQDMESWSNQYEGRFYEVDANGNIIQNLANVTNAESGRNVMPAVWLPIFPETVIGGNDWRFDTLVHPANGKTYKYAPRVYAGAVAPTPGNPMGLSGGVNATTGNPSNTAFTMDDTNEKSWGASLFSEWWRGKIDTMLGLRRESATGIRKALGQVRREVSYDGITAGFVADTPIKDLRLSGNYSSNGKINFDTTLDINNQPLPAGKGVSRDVGFKFDLFDRRVSGNVNYYKSEALNFTATNGSRDQTDPNGINGRHGGPAYVYSKTSDGYNLTLSARPLRNWEVRASFATANGAERSDVTLPQFYNDQFNTMSLNGQTVVAIKGTGGALSPLLVPTDPKVPTSTQIPLSIAMLKDRNSPYFAILDNQGGWITNAQQLGLLTTGVGTGATGLPLSEHQLGFTSPTDGTIIVRKAGEATVGYAERAYSLVNNYRFSEGRLRGLSLGIVTSYQQQYRGYMYNDSLDARKRKMFYFPDRTLHDFFASYGFKVSSTLRASVQINVNNALDSNRILYLRSSTDGSFRYAQLFNSPRKLSITTRLTY